MESGPLSDERFAALGEDYVLFCSIDSDAEGWKNGDLRERKKLKGLPSVAFLEPNGDVLIQVPLEKRSIDGFRSAGKRAEEYVRLRAAAAQGDRRTAARFLRMQLEERQVDLADALGRRAAVQADEKLAAVLDRLILHLRISTELRARGQKRRWELGARYYAMWTKGPRPGLDVGRGFWYAILEWAERERKLEEFAVAIAGMRQCLEHTDPEARWVGPLLARYEQKLERARAASRSRRKLP